MKNPIWIIPSFRKEKGEIERVAQHFQLPKSFVRKFLANEKTALLVPLREAMWNLVENTDSKLVKLSDWNYVAKCTNAYKRDWQTLREKMMTDAKMDSPIIYHNKGIYHLVSGNTRLMVAKALGITPQVVIVEERYRTEPSIRSQQKEI